MLMSLAPSPIASVTAFLRFLMSSTTWAFCSGVTLQQMTALHAHAVDTNSASMSASRAWAYHKTTERGFRRSGGKRSPSCCFEEKYLMRKNCFYVTKLKFLWQISCRSVIHTRLWPLITMANSPEMLSIKLERGRGGGRGEPCSCFPTPPPLPPAVSPPSCPSLNPFPLKHGSLHPCIPSSLTPSLVRDSSIILSLALLERKTNKAHINSVYLHHRDIITWQHDHAQQKKKRSECGIRNIDSQKQVHKG